MLKHYFLSSLRNIKKTKWYSAINIIGLGIAVCCFILVYSYFDHEMNYDAFRNNAANLYRVTVSSGGGTLGTTSELVQRELKNDFNRVESSARIQILKNIPVKKNDKMFYEDNVLFGDHEFINMFSLRFISGNIKDGLQRPGTVIITKNMAEKYFSGEDPNGKLIKLGDKYFEITGVVENPPTNTHLNYNFIASFATIEPELRYSDWTQYSYVTYAKLFASASPASVASKITGASSGYFIDYPEDKQTYNLQPVTDIHTNSGLKWDVFTAVDKSFLFILLAVGIITIIIASINFINVSIARALSRAKEIGIRKVAGAERKELVYQFLIESLILSICSVVIAVLLMQILLPLFNSIAGMELTLLNLLSVKWGVIIFGLILFTGAVTGVYPAFLMSSFNPVSTIKKNITASSKGKLLRTTLLAVQFTASIALIISVSVMYCQINFMKNKNLGYNKENKLVIKIPKNDKGEIENLKTEFESFNTIKSVTASSTVPGKRIAGASIYRPGEDKGKQAKKADYLYADKDFINDYQMEIIAGDKNRITSQGLQESILINETLSRLYGWNNPQDAVGEFIITGTDDKQVEIAGVVKNFHVSGLQKIISPLLICYDPDMFKVITLTINSLNTKETIQFAKAKFEKLFPDIPFSYYFVDENFDLQYKKDEKTVNIFLSFAGLSILISCFGLLGLVSLTAEKKTKEIGVRKILGSSVNGIVALLIKDFAGIILIAGIIASFPAYLIMKDWLNDYAYHIEISLWVFISAIAFTIIFSLGVISYQAVKAAVANPIDSLKNE